MYLQKSKLDGQTLNVFSSRISHKTHEITSAPNIYYKYLIIFYTVLRNIIGGFGNVQHDHKWKTSVFNVNTKMMQIVFVYCLFCDHFQLLKLMNLGMYSEYFDHIVVQYVL